MKKWKLFFVILFFSAFAENYAIARDVTIAVGLALPPYVISESNTGMETDIVRESLELKGYNMHLKYLPFARVPKAIEKGTVDAAMPINEASGITNVYYSNSHMTYQNVAVTRKQDNFVIASIEDLKQRRIVAFQNATKYLGEEFKKTVKASPEYKEQAKQELQVLLLFKGRTEVLVLDINIFKYYRQHTKKLDTSDPVTIHSIFPPSHYKIAFNNQKIRDDFNDGLRQLRESGRYEQIISNYVK